MRPDRNATSARPLPVDVEAVRKIIVDGDVEQLVKSAEELGKNLVEVGLAASQIRNIFGTARQIQANWPMPNPKNPDMNADKQRAARRALVLLKPKLAYLAKREEAVRPLQDWLIRAIDAVRADDIQQEYRHFTHFMDFFEATLAYHTAQGGRQQEERRRN
jgi:CRISPR-associated protein Csm2